MSIHLTLLALAALSASWTAAHSADLGTIGPTYDIAEPHLLQMIEQRLREKERSGELARIEQDARERGTETVRRPVPVAGVRTTAIPRTFYFDPTYTLDQNLLGAKGELLFAAGTKANPLNVVSMTRHLLFFDGRDSHQVRRARELMAQYQGKVKPILTGGSYLDLMKSWGIPCTTTSRASSRAASASRRCRRSSHRKVSDCASTRWRWPDEDRSA